MRIFSHYQLEMFILTKYSVDEKETVIVDIIDDIGTNGFTKAYDKLIKDIESIDDNWHSKKIISNRRVEVYEKSLIWPNRLVHIYQILERPKPNVISKKEIEEIKNELKRNMKIFK